ncbi:MAG: hypothetical protein QM764_18315 [Chitinophagaceae bacterium]
MKKSKLLLPCLVCATIMIFVACKKGDTGPAGPAGTTGATGATGAAGPAGTANVIYSDWTDTLTYYLTTATTTDTIFGDLSVPKLTADILNSGDIKVYVNLGSADDPLVVPLPYTGGDGGYILTYFFTGGIEIESNLNIDGIPIRYVLIPGGTAARTYKQINWNNYAEVKAYLGLKN